MSASTVTWTVTARAGFPLPVLDGQITVDANRNPQVSADLTVPFTDWTTAKAFDVFSRAPVWLEIRQDDAVRGTLATFGQGQPAGTLGSLKWATKQSPSSALVTSPQGVVVKRLQLYTTDAVVDEKAGTVAVSLASADYLLQELINFGYAWTPRPASIEAGATYTPLNQAFAEFFRFFAIPLSTATEPQIFSLINVEPWETGQNAWSWLDGLRRAAQYRYVLDATTGTVQWVAPNAITPLAAGVIDRDAATSVSVRRSVENAAEGVNQYADSWAMHWLGQDGAPDQWEFSTSIGDWRQMRRAYVEDEPIPPYSWWRPVGYADYRLTRSQLFKRTTTVKIPLDPLAMPFRDLTNHPHGTAVQTIVYDYLSGDVTTTYLEAD